MKQGVLPWILLAIVLFACGIAAGYILWGQPAAPAPVIPTPTPVPTTLPPTPSPQPTPLPSPVGSWTLTALTLVSGGSSVVQYPSGNITAIFTMDGKVQGSGGCNSYGGSYTTSGSSIAVTDVVSTLMSCGNVLDTQERAYLSILQEASTFETGGGMLTIRTGSTPPGKLVFQAE